MPQLGTSQIVASQVLDAFRRFDQNGNGHLEKSEITNLMRGLDPSFSDDMIQGMMQIADVDGNEVVDYTEFLRWVFLDDQQLGVSTSASSVRQAAGLSRAYTAAISACCPRRLILVRHGESEGNVDQNIYQSVADGLLHLTEEGWKQARCAGRELKKLIGDEPVKFMVSPYVRTRETFNAIVESFGGADTVEWYEDPRIREQDFGNFQNVEDVQRAKQERQNFGAFFYRMPHGESPSDVYDRLSSFFETMYRSWDTTPSEVMGNLNYVVVCHGITIAVFLMRLFKYSVDEFHRWHNFTNAEFCVMERQPDGKYTQESLYCVKQKRDGDIYKGVQGPRTLQKDAGRFDRFIRVRPESEEGLDMTRTVSADDRYEVKVFVPGERIGFRCNEANRIETVLPDTQADHLDVMPGWYLCEVNGEVVPHGQACQAMQSAKEAAIAAVAAKEAGMAVVVKFRCPAS